MTLLDRVPRDVADDVLITRVRGGDLDAYGELFARHRDSALRLAQSLCRGAEADDLVSDAFAKILNALQSGSGPDVAFRAYLLTTIRRVHIDRIRAQQRTTPTDDVAALDQGVPFSDTAVADFESSAAARAFGSLPERWQMVLWHLEVEGQKPADIAPMLGISPNAVAALAYRAREGLRQAFVQMHATEPATSQECHEVREQLGAYVRGGLSKRDSAKVSSHLEECRRCTALYLELTEVNASLAAVLGPLVLGGAAAAYLAGSTATSGGVIAGLGLMFGRVRDAIAANSTAAAVTAAAVAVGAVGVGAYALTAHHKPAHPTAGPAVVREHAPLKAPEKPSTKPHTKVHPTMRTHPRHTTSPVPPPTSLPAARPAATTPASPSPASIAPTPIPEPRPTPTPTPTPAAPRSAISLAGPSTATGQAVLTVHGLPDGATGSVTLQVPPTLSWWITPGCVGTRSLRTCPVSAISPDVTVRFMGLLDRRFIATFMPSPRVIDTSSGDDSVTVRMRGLVSVVLRADHH